MGFDRSKYKAVSLSSIRKQESEQQQVRPKLSKTDQHDIEQGDNWFRIAPVHPGGTSPFQAKTVSFLEVMVPKKDADKRVIEGEFVLGKKPIFHARVHGGSNEDGSSKYEVDLVDEYMRIAKEIAIPNFTDDEKIQKIIWNKISGFDVVKKESGIKPIDSWECYAWNKDGKFADLSFKSQVKTALTELAASVSKDPTDPDPFTDPEDGIAIVITKTGEKINTKYTVKLDSQMIDKFNSRLVPTPLTEDQLIIFDKVKPLHERYTNAFKYKDLQWQLEGLKNFDEKLSKEGFGILVFQYTEFLDVVEKQFELTPETEDSGEGEDPKQEEAQPATPPKKIVPKTFADKPIRQKPVIQEEPKEDVVSEEEVKEKIVPKKLGRSVVNVAVAPPTDGPAGKHIDDTQARLDAIRSRFKK